MWSYRACEWLPRSTSSRRKHEFLEPAFVDRASRIMDPWKVREVKIEVKIYQLLQSLKKRRTGVELASFLNLPLCHIEVEMNRRTGTESTNTQLIDPWLVYRQIHNFAAS